MPYFKRVYTHAISWQSTGRSSLVTVTGCEGTAWKCVRVGDRKSFFTIVQNRLPRAVGHSPELVLELKEHFDAALSSLSGPYSVRKGYLCCPTAHLSLLCTMLSKGWAPACTNVSKTEAVTGFAFFIIIMILNCFFKMVHCPIMQESPEGATGMSLHADRQNFFHAHQGPLLCQRNSCIWSFSDFGGPQGAWGHRLDSSSCPSTAQWTSQSCPHPQDSLASCRELGAIHWTPPIVPVEQLREQQSQSCTLPQGTSWGHLDLGLSTGF